MLLKSEVADHELKSIGTARSMETKIILTEKDIKRAIQEYLVNTNRGVVRSIRFEQGSSEICADPREYSTIYAEVELEVETETL